MISFTAAPDAGVSLTELQNAFEATLSEVANGGIPEATYSRVLDRFDGFWPDWNEDDEAARWRRITFLIVYPTCASCSPDAN